MSASNQMVVAVCLMYFFLVATVTASFVFDLFFGLAVVSLTGLGISAYWATRAGDKMLDISEHPKVKEWIEKQKD